MNNREEQFLDYLEGKLAETEKQEFEAALSEDRQLKASFEAYQKVLQAEKALQEEQYSLGAGFDVEVMEALERDSTSLIRRLVMWYEKHSRMAVASVATFATLVVVVKLAVDTPSELLEYRKQTTEVVSEIKKNVTENEGSKPQTGPVIAKEANSSATTYNDSRLHGPGPADSIVGKIINKLAPEFFDDSHIQEEPITDIPRGKRSRELDQNLTKPQAVTAQRFQDKKKDFAAENIPAFSQQKREEATGLVLDGLSSPVEAHHRQLVAPGMSIHPPQPTANRERYAEYIENQRIAVLDNPLSTFSIDVDTGSYTNARRFLRSGNLPPANAVRIEEFINYFDYQYPVQNEKPFTLSYEVAPSPLETDRFLLKLGIKAKDAKTSEKPWNLVFLVDVSGSMSSDDKLGLVQRSLKLLAHKMRTGDRIAIVTYAGNAGLALPSSGIENKQQILQTISRLRSGGSTHGSAGIHLAYQIAHENFLSNGVNRVVLATDGDFNVGTTSQRDLIHLIEEKRKSGITLTTVGVGSGNYNESMMEQLANKGNGNYFYLDSFQEARKVFETDLSGTIEVVAKDVKLQIEFNPAHVAQYRLIGYENRKLKKEDFHNDAIDAGEIGSGHTVTALYEIVFTDTELAKQIESDSRYQKRKKSVEVNNDFQKELAFLKVRYKDPKASTSKLLQFPIEKRHVRSSVENSSEDFRFAAAVSYFGHLLRKSTFAGNYNFDDIATLAHGARGQDKNGYRREFVELVRNAAAIQK